MSSNRWFRLKTVTGIPPRCGIRGPTSTGPMLQQRPSFFIDEDVWAVAFLHAATVVGSAPAA